MTALMWAAKAGNFDTVSLLVAKDADLGIADKVIDLCICYMRFHIGSGVLFFA